MFAHDACTATTSRAGLEQAVEVLLRVTSQWGINTSIPKNRLMVDREGLQEDNVAPIQTDNGIIHVVAECKYLQVPAGTLVFSSRGIEGDVRERISHASRVFGILQKTVLQDKDLSVTSKRLVMYLLYWVHSSMDQRRRPTRTGPCRG